MEFLLIIFFLFILASAFGGGGKKRKIHHDAAPGMDVSPYSGELKPKNFFDSI
jgi:hypothetical protein